MQENTPTHLPLACSLQHKAGLMDDSMLFTSASNPAVSASQQKLKRETARLTKFGGYATAV